MSPRIQLLSNLCQSSLSICFILREVALRILKWLLAAVRVTALLFTSSIREKASLPTTNGYKFSTMLGTTIPKTEGLPHAKWLRSGFLQVIIGTERSGLGGDKIGDKLNYSPWVKSSPQHVFTNKVLLEYSYTRLCNFIYMFFYGYFLAGKAVV